MEKVIIDTDPAIGVLFHDGDGLAVALALNSPELGVAGDHGDDGNVDQKRAYQSARRIIKAMGREDVPVFAGARSAEDSANRRPSDASRFIASRIAAEPGAVTILAIGPLSNLAAAERLAPGTLRAAKCVVAMGGAVDRPGTCPHSCARSSTSGKTRVRWKYSARSQRSHDRPTRPDDEGHLRKRRNGTPARLRFRVPAMAFQARPRLHSLIPSRCSAAVSSARPARRGVPPSPGMVRHRDRRNCARSPAA